MVRAGRSSATEHACRPAPCRSRWSGPVARSGAHGDGQLDGRFGRPDRRAGSTSTSRISGSLDAFVGDAAVVTVTSAMVVRSTGTATSTADARGGSGGGITVSAFFATATIAPISGTNMGTRAWVGGGANVRAGSLSVTARATDNATATILAVSDRPGWRRWWKCYGDGRFGCGGFHRAAYPHGGDGDRDDGGHRRGAGDVDAEREGDGVDGCRWCRGGGLRQRHEHHRQRRAGVRSVVVPT